LLAAQRFALDLEQGGFQPVHIQLLAKHFLLGLGEQQVAGVVLAKDTEEKIRRSLQLAGAFRSAGKAGEDKTGDAGDFAESALTQFAGIEACNYIFQEKVSGE